MRISLRSALCGLALTLAVTGGGTGLSAQGADPAAAPARNIRLEADPYSGGHCAEDKTYCLRMIAPDVVAYSGPGGLRGQLGGLPLRARETAAPAPQLIELVPGHVLMGIEFSSHDTISDGRMQRREAVYWDVDMRDGSVLGPMLEFTAHVGIDTEDCRNWPAERQAGGCSARYVFNSIIDAIDAPRDGYPVLTYRTAAVINPAGASREYGWTTPTSVGSGGEELHLGCTFRRSYIFNPLSGRYMLDQPLPDCDQFLSVEMLPRRNRDRISELQMRPATAAEVQNHASYSPDVRALLAAGKTQVELGWLYNEMTTGADVIVLRFSENGLCAEADSCHLLFFATANCVDPAECRPKWVQSLRGNRIYTVRNPRAPLSQSCPETLFLAPRGGIAASIAPASPGLPRRARCRRRSPR